MGRIQSSIGLMSGVPITDTVDQLMKLNARPRDNLVKATEKLDEERVAITELSALLVATQYVGKNLGKDDIFERKTASTSNEAAMTAKVTGNPINGTHQLTPIQTAQSQQWLSAGVRSDQQPLGSGTITFRHGPHVQRAVTLDQINGGAGFQRGAIRITDRSGSSAEIDLTGAQTIEDVVSAISADNRINVTAVAEGDHIRLIDQTGSSLTHLRVQEVNGGSTAASLGLAGIDTDASTADGADILFLAGDLDLTGLNDGNGIGVSDTLPDVSFTLRDGTTGTIDFAALLPDSSENQREETLGELLETINQAAPGRLQAEIAPDGKRLVLRDLTTGSGNFEVEALYGSAALEDLGLDGQAVDGVIEGRRVLGGLQTVLLSSLNGGQGFGELGTLQLTDRAGNNATVDLSSAETLHDVVQAINGAGVGITAQVNSAKNGIQLTDTSSGAGNLVIASGDDRETAEKLQLAFDAAESTVNSGDLHLQIVSGNTRLADLNGGAGVARGQFTITDSAGSQSVIDLSQDDVQTLGDVIKEINRASADVQARLNDTGDGILIRDLAGGDGHLAVHDMNSTTAADLHLTRQAETRDENGQSVQAIDGSATISVEITEEDTLDTLRQKINEAGAGVHASTFIDGSSRPYRLSLTSEQAGRRGELVIDSSALGLDLQQIVRGQDALLVLGQPGSPGATLVSSSDNQFDGVISGVRLNVRQPSSVPVNVEVKTTDDDLVATVKTFVENYNKLHKRLKELTKYDPQTNKGEILASDPTAIRLQSDLQYLLSSRFAGAGSVQSLGGVGITFTDEGKMEFDANKLRTRYLEDPEGVKKFFTDEDFGFAAKFDKLAEQLVGEESSLMTERLKTLTRKYERNQERIEQWNERLEAQRERLLLEFYRMDLAIGKMRTNLEAISLIQPISYNRE